MRYFQNCETLKVIAMEDTPRPVDLWFEIEQEDYDAALHPLSRPTKDAPDFGESSAEKDLSTMIDDLIYGENL